MGFPIRRSLDQSLFAAPQSFSQRTTSFIASQCQGIHRMPLRRLIALIINTHPASLRAEPGSHQLPGLPSIGSTLNMIRKTILLHHPSGSRTLQDLSLCPRSGLLRSGPILRSDQTKFARGFVSNPQRGQKQPDECLFTMSNNTKITAQALWPRRDDLGKTFPSSDKDLDTNPSHRLVEPDGIEPTTS